MSRLLHVPAGMSREDLLDVLDEIRAGVETGDTLEGNIEFTLPFPPAGSPKSEALVVQRAAEVYAQAQGARSDALREVEEWLLGLAEVSASRRERHVLDRFRDRFRAGGERTDGS